MGCGISIVKYLIFIFNFVFALAGLGLLIAGILIEIQVSNIGEFLDGKFQAPAILLIVVGSIIFFVAFFGCCGALKESYCYVVMYAIMLLTIFIVQVVVAGLAFAYRDDVKDALDEKLSNSVANYYNSASDREAIDNIQNRLKCCGYNKPTDYPYDLPGSCCIDDVPTCSYGLSQVHYMKGCKEALRDFINRNGNIIGGVAIGVCAIELVGVIFALCLANSIKNEGRRGKVSGTIGNTGHSVIFTVDNTTRHHVNVTGGPLSYKYQFQEIHVHYGLHDDSGSEHSINGYTFPAEIQIFGFNSQLYANFTEALHRAQGIVAISLLLQLGDLSNPELRILTDQLDKIRHGGQEIEVRRLSIRGLLPDTDFYMTYDGSTTMPACHETVTWVILNKPIYITKQQLHALRRLMQGDGKHPQAPLGNNFRPPQPLHHRPVRTNIDFNVKQGGGKYCPSMYREVYYKANTWKQH